MFWRCLAVHFVFSGDLVREQPGLTFFIPQEILDPVGLEIQRGNGKDNVSRKSSLPQRRDKGQIGGKLVLGSEDKDGIHVRSVLAKGGLENGNHIANSGSVRRFGEDVGALDIEV